MPGTREMARKLTFHVNRCLKYCGFSASKKKIVITLSPIWEKNSKFYQSRIPEEKQNIAKKLTDFPVKINPSNFFNRPKITSLLEIFKSTL